MRAQGINPAILQDSRDLPKVDGRFGFLYRTEDGIAHAAKGEPGGVVHGRFTYTDPTGLKVNYNYNAGTGVTPKYKYDEPISAYDQRQNQNGGQGRYRTSDGYEEEEYAQAPEVAVPERPQREYERPRYESRPQRREKPSQKSRNLVGSNYEY